MNQKLANGPKDFPDTEPMMPDTPAALDQLSLAPVEATLYDVTALLRHGDRICPQPSRWLEFYRVLQEAAPGTERPPEPLVGSTWASSPPVAKRTCFQQQIEWADTHKVLQPAYDFLKSLRDSDWYVA